MLVNTLEIEGTWEEISAQAAPYAGRKMRLTILPEIALPISEARDCRSLEEKMAEIIAAIPEEELAKFPTDRGDNIDHYVYGTRKR